MNFRGCFRLSCTVLVFFSLAPPTIQSDDALIKFGIVVNEYGAFYFCSHKRRLNGGDAKSGILNRDTRM